MSHEESRSKLLNKLSPLIEGQVPEFVQADHPVFVDFLKDYFQFLEAGRLELQELSGYDSIVNYIRQETNTTAYVLLEDGERVITESGLGTDSASISKFVNGEIVTGQTSKATATILVEDSRNSVLYISSQQKFENNEQITGGTSGAKAIVKRYRANPVQNIQQLLEYADVDHTIFDFLDQMRDSFMSSIPSTLATNTSKRNLLKNIKDLYAAKGSSEGHKLFMRLLLGEEAEIVYPTEFVMRPSDGNWSPRTVLRVTAINVDGQEVVGRTITGQSSGATAIVDSSTTFLQGTTSVIEFDLVDIDGTFTSGEIVKATSTTRDVDVQFTVTSILSTASIVNDGVLYDEEEPIVVELTGNEFAEVRVETIKRGGVSGVIVDDVGTGYQIKDSLTFTSPSADTDVELPTGFVSVVGGGIRQESGTLDDSDVTTDNIILERGSTFTAQEPFEIILESGLNNQDFFTGNGINRSFKLNNISTLTDTIEVYVDDVLTPATAKNGDTVFTIESAPFIVLNGTDGSSTDAGDNILLEVDDAPQTGSVLLAEQQEILFSLSPVDYTPAAGARIKVFGDRVNFLLLDGTDGSKTHAGSKVITNNESVTIDAGRTDNDGFILEEDTFTGSEKGSLQRAIISSQGRGFTDLPTITITTVNGSGAKLIATTDSIGAIDSVKITEPGLNYGIAPDLTPRSHFLVKDITGTFASSNTLTSHEGTVKGFDSSTQILDVEFEDVVRIDAEQSGADVGVGILLEEATFNVGITSGFLLEDAEVTGERNAIIMDASAESTRGSRIERKKVTKVTNTLSTIAESTTDASLGLNIFAIDDLYTKSDFSGPPLTFFRGDTYYFDLSDPSLFNIVSTQNHELAFATLADRFTGDGTTTSFTLGKTVETTPIAFVTISNTSFENNVRAHADAYTTAYTAIGDTITFDSAPALGAHIIVFIKYTTGVTTSPPRFIVGGGYYDEDGDGLIEQGNGAFIQIETTADTPDLYYYCVNHGPRMGFSISVRTVSSFLSDVGDNIILDAESIGSKPQGILLEDGAQDVSGFGIALNGTDASGSDAGSRVQQESDGGVILLNLGSEQNRGQSVLTLELPDIKRFEKMRLNATDGSGTDAGDNIILETGTESVGTTENGVLRDALLLSEELISVVTVPSSENVFLLESAFIDLQHENSNIISEDIEIIESRGGSILLDGTTNGLEGDRLISESSQLELPVIVLDGTDANSNDANSKLLGIENEGFEEVVLNGIDSSSTFAGDNIILETPIDFSNNDVVITDSGGASATIVKSDKATLTSSVETVTELAGSFVGIESLLGEDLNRIQDSYYYQDYSYEIQVGESLTTYLNELKKAVHPTGFIPFGKVSIASSVSAGVVNAAAGVSDSTTETRFSPILASVLETIFDQLLQSRLQVTPTTSGIGQRDDQIILETEGAILYESGSVNAETTNAATEGGGRVMAESSHAPSADADRFLARQITTKVSTLPNPRVSRNLLLYLANNPFGSSDSVQLETATANNTSHLVLDGEIPLAQETTFIILESGESVLLEPFDGSASKMIAEMDQFAFPLGFKVHENERVILEDDREYTETIPLSEIGTFRFEDILQIDNIISDENAVDQDNANAVENTGILMENFGQLLLDGTDSSSSNAGSYVAQETTKNDRITLDESGSLIVEDFSTFSVIENLISENTINETIILEDFFTPRNTFGIRLEQDSYNEDVIILDGIDSNSTDAGIKLELEEFFQSDTIRDGRVILEDSLRLTVNDSGQNIDIDPLISDNLLTEDGDRVVYDSERFTANIVDERLTAAIQLETTKIFTSEGQIPLGNWTLNSSTNPTGYQPVVHASEIRVRSTGDIALEDATDTTHGFLVLNGTDGSSTNAGDNIDCEGATGITA